MTIFIGMYTEDKGPIIESRHYGHNPDARKSRIMKVIGLIIVLLAVSLYFAVEEMPLREDSMPMSEEADETLLNEEMIEETQPENELTTEQAIDVKQQLEEEAAIKAGAELSFYYERALKRESEKDYNGAIEDYTKTIEYAKRYSVEMFNALNNRGIIYAEQLKDYKKAQKDFNKIIEIETNRYDGNANDTRLEAGYTNRAYVKKKRGDTEGACDDLYEALGLGIEKSAAFIEKQIDQNCL